MFPQTDAIEFGFKLTNEYRFSASFKNIMISNHHHFKYQKKISTKIISPIGSGIHIHNYQLNNPEDVLLIKLLANKYPKLIDQYLNDLKLKQLNKL